MNKTLLALDNFLSSIITLIPTWLSMLKSTRNLTFIATLVLMYVTWKYGGIPEEYAPFVQGIIGALGLGTIGFKTLRSGAPAANGVISPQVTEIPIGKVKCPGCGKMVDDRTWCSECGYILHPTVPPVPKYIVPPSLAEKGADKPTAFLRWLELDGMMNWDLTQHNSQVRMEFASDIVRENKTRLDAAWTEALIASNVKTKDFESTVPTAQDFETYEATEAFRKKIQDLTPGCEWLTKNQDLMLKGYGRCFEGFLWVSKLFDKSINWQLAHSVNELIKHGYAAVLT